MLRKDVSGLHDKPLWHDPRNEQMCRKSWAFPVPFGTGAATLKITLSTPESVRNFESL